MSRQQQPAAMPQKGSSRRLIILDYFAPLFRLAARGAGLWTAGLGGL
ncbi:MAG: hypothetical protein LUH42_05785 [Oscillospiraceae bacterium]|nr:hypothetical protein [Oscillospiraceae bacterium]